MIGFTAHQYGTCTGNIAPVIPVLSKSVFTVKSSNVFEQIDSFENMYNNKVMEFE